MDVKEKYEALRECCKSHLYCKHCPLVDKRTSDCRAYYSTYPVKHLSAIADQIEKDYAKVFPANEPAPVKEMVDHPQHYNNHQHECIDEMIALFGVEAVKGFCKCNVHKYRYRSADKNGQEDLKKADWYMTKLIELEGGKTDGN